MLGHAPSEVRRGAVGGREREGGVGQVRRGRECSAGWERGSEGEQWKP